ncbi:MAG TPA: glycosyltransferase [Gemmatimonadota bacterium]|nr:glycosyltransferase [Gemmatimonadota bacterium]
MKRTGDLDRSYLGSRAGVAPSTVEEPTSDIEISIIVILEGNAERAREIYREYAPSLRDLGRGFEFLFMTGPSSADFAAMVESLDARRGSFRVLELGHSLGHADLLKLALEHCRGEIIVTLPASLRVAPDAIPQLVECLDQGSEMAAARRWPRHDGWVNRAQSRFCNRVLNLLTGSDFHDITCRVNAVRRRVLSEIPLYGSYFRFLPIVAERQGFGVREVTVGQHRQYGGARVYSPGVYLGWLIDILGIFFLLRFTYRPLRFFGLVGAAFGAVGGAILTVLLIQRLGGQGIADRPLLLLGVLLVTLGVQSVALGLIGEIVVHFQASRNSTYRLAPTDRSAPSPGS